MDRFRGRSIGVVFQRLHLLSAISVLNNLLLAQRLARMAPDKKKAMRLLDRLGIAAQAHVVACNAKPRSGTTRGYCPCCNSQSLTCDR